MFYNIHDKDPTKIHFFDTYHSGLIVFSIQKQYIEDTKTEFVTTELTLQNKNAPFSLSSL